MTSLVRPPGRTTSTRTTPFSGSLPGPVFKTMHETAIINLGIQAFLLVFNTQPCQEINLKDR
jgi:hypothetical protein